MKTTLLIPFFLTVSVGLVSGQAQHPAIPLFEQGKFADAIVALEISVKTPQFKSDPEIWNYLGLAYLASGSSKKSRKAFEKSVELDPSSPTFRANLAYAYLAGGQLARAVENADEAIKLNPRTPDAYDVRAVANFRRNKLDLAERDADLFIEFNSSNPRAYLLKADILVAKFGERLMSGRSVTDEIAFLKRAVETLQTGSAKCKTGRGCSPIAQQLESITVFYQYFLRQSTEPNSPSMTAPAEPEPGVVPVKITYQPKARYTDSAREANVQGAIRVALLLSADGRVEQVLFLSRLGYGLDQEVLRAAQSIKFQPKQKDGKPVSTVVIREYTFSIY